MKKITTIITLLIVTMSHAQNNEKKEMLVGKITKSDLLQEPFAIWFKTGEESYKPKATAIDLLKKIKQDYTISIFMGTWCGDSKEQVPHFYKIMTAIDFDLSKTTLIAVNREKTTPEKYEGGLNITNVPTFIFYKNGKEIKRIVETPVETVEEDMLKILTAQPYKHQYE
jgi:thiol-disulfide isomerase/thioredoxin